MEFRFVRPEIATLCATYAAIAETLPQVRIERGPACEIATGPFAHPICNYGILLGQDGLRAVLAAASGRPHFNIYTFASAETPDVPGYRPMVSMVTMVSPPPSELANVPSPVPESMRMGVAAFMTEQFFSASRPDIRERVAFATASTKGTDLYAFTNDHGELCGAAMLSWHTSMAGLYNVCVRPDLRGHGRGTAIVQQMQWAASERGRAVTLQCGTALQPWYEALGFRTVDTVTVWSAAP